MVNIKTREEASPKYNINSLRLVKKIIKKEIINAVKKITHKKYMSFNPIFRDHFKIGPIVIAIKNIKIKGAKIVL
jgi:hypothetical protein